MICDVTPGLWTTEYKTLDSVTERGAEIRTAMRDQPRARVKAEGSSAPMVVVTRWLPV